MTVKLDSANIKEQLELLFTNLFEKQLIFHERVTILCELVAFELKDDRFSVELKAIKALNKTNEGQNRMFEHITSKPTFTVCATYTMGDYKILNGKKIGRPYCPFILFADPIIVEKIGKLSGQELAENISDLMWSKEK